MRFVKHADLLQQDRIFQCGPVEIRRRLWRRFPAFRGMAAFVHTDISGLR